MTVGGKEGGGYFPVLVTKYLDNTKPIELTAEQIKQLEALKDRPIRCDEDCPPLTDEQIKRYLAAKRQKAVA